MDSLAQQIQAMGVEADHNSSLEEALAEVRAVLALDLLIGARVNHVFGVCVCVCVCRL